MSPGILAQGEGLRILKKTALRVYETGSPFLAFAIVAGLISFLWFYKVILYPRPFWIYETDLELDYAFNSFVVASGNAPVWSLHPGTPIQLLGGLIARLLKAGPAEIQKFLFSADVVSLAATLAVLWLFIKSILVYLPVLLKVSIGLSLFLTPPSLLYLGYWGSEVFIIPFGLITWWALWQSFGGADPLSQRAVFIAGLCAGLSCAVKLVFAPIVPAALAGYSISILALEKLKMERFGISRSFDRAYLFLSAGYLALVVLGTIYLPLRPEVVFFLWTTSLVNLAFLITIQALIRMRPHSNGGLKERLLAVIRVDGEFLLGVLIGWVVGTWPVFHRYELVLKHVLDGLVTNVYHKSTPGTTDLLWLAGQLFIAVPVWSALMLAAIGLLGVTVFLLMRKRTDTSGGALGFSVALFCSLVLGLIWALRNGFPTSYLRFLLPVNASVSCGLAWLGYLWLMPERLRKTAFRIGFITASAAVCLAFGEVALSDLRSHHQLIEDGYSHRQALDRRLDAITQQLGRKPVIYSSPHGVGLPSYALRGGDWNVQYRFRKQIDQLYPNEHVTPYSGDRAIAFLHSVRGRFDLILIREEELAQSDKDFLRTLGTIERWPGGLFVVKANHL